jgi:type 1 glutamine amidotransferase
MLRATAISLLLLLGECSATSPARSCAADAPRIKILIVDGYSNHDWQRTTQLLRGILEPTGLFEISVSTAPAKKDDPSSADWRPAFERYDVVLLNCNNLGGGPTWPQPAREAFERFVRGGGGVFVFHSANNSFAEWEEYNRIIGLGWRKKDYGWAITVNEDGSLQRIPPGEGNGTGHGPRTDRVIHRLGDHSIHAGLPRQWKTPAIEVYTYARGPAENLTVLSWAEDEATHTRWPIEWTVEYGKGRVYNSTFGHVWRGEKDPVGVRCAGFQTVLARALHWLAKRPVPETVPNDFPDEKVTLLRPLP